MVAAAPQTAHIISLGSFLFRENLPEFTLGFSLGVLIMP